MPKPRRYSSDWNKPPGEVPTLHRSFLLQEAYDFAKAVHFCKTTAMPVNPEAHLAPPPLLIAYGVLHLLKLDHPEGNLWSGRAAPYTIQMEAVPSLTIGDTLLYTDYAGLEFRIFQQMYTGPGGFRAGELATLFGSSYGDKVSASAFGGRLYGLGNVERMSTNLDGIVHKISMATARTRIRTEPEVKDFELPTRLFPYRPFSAEPITRPVRGTTWHERLLQDGIG